MFPVSHYQREKNIKVLNDIANERKEKEKSIMLRKMYVLKEENVTTLKISIYNIVKQFRKKCVCRALLTHEVIRKL